MIKHSFKIVRWFLSLATLLLAFLLLAAPFYIYDRFNIETAVAELEFDKISDQNYLAHLSTENLCTTRDYRLQGDQWQLDAEFIKWKGAAVLLGFESHYRLDRLNGRYANSEQQNSEQSSAHELSPEVLFDFFPSNKTVGEKGLFVDTFYGSSVYMAIDETKRYRIYKTEDGLIVRTEERAKPIDESPVLTISITKACETSPNLLDRLARQINRWAIQLL